MNAHALGNAEDRFPEKQGISTLYKYCSWGADRFDRLVDLLGGAIYFSPPK
jgi:hypothetical protein